MKNVVYSVFFYSIKDRSNINIVPISISIMMTIMIIKQYYVITIAILTISIILVLINKIRVYIGKRGRQDSKEKGVDKTPKMDILSKNGSPKEVHQLILW